jgi:CheY-like chemotaxis protein/tRNA A-37 threonylcarbamoyl transferase component Bud32
MEHASQAPRLSGEDFIQHLCDSGLISRDEIGRSLAGLAGEAPPDAEGLARHLVAAGKLTAYQAEAVRERKFSELLIGNYEVLDRLGAGGMGTVFKARHRRMKRVVALKVLSRAACESDTFVQRFQREVEVISRLSHPNIVMAFDADEADVGHFLVMEFVNGRDLASEVQKRGPLPVREAVEAILQAARALEYAHAQGIIHRDVKPANLLCDEAGVVKVADLGLARCGPAPGASATSGLTQAGGIVGTVDYMPPEQAFDSTSIDRRADVYSLGCSLYYLLAARPPYQGESLMAIFLKHREAPIPSLAASRPDVPVAVEAVFRKMVAKKPEDRFQTMAEVVRALEALEVAPGGLPLAAAPPAAPSPACVSTAMLASGETTVAAPPAEADSGVTVDLATLQKAAPAAGPILLVEPSRTQANIIRKMLQDLKADTVLVAPSGSKALEVMRLTPPRAVLCAMHLDDMTGAELLQKMRADLPLAKVGFVLITSNLTDSAPEMALKTAAHTALLPKPFDRDKLGLALAAAGVQAG